MLTTTSWWTSSTQILREQRWDFLQLEILFKPWLYCKVEAECQELKAENDLASQEVEALWAEKQAREAQIQQLEVVFFILIIPVMPIITITINILACPSIND